MNRFADPAEPSKDSLAPITSSAAVRELTAPRPIKPGFPPPPPPFNHRQPPTPVHGLRPVGPPPFNRHPAEVELRPRVQDQAAEMKFGERILKEMHPALVDHYLPYNDLKQILKALAFLAQDDVSEEG